MVVFILSSAFEKGMKCSTTEQTRIPQTLREEVEEIIDNGSTQIIVTMGWEIVKSWSKDGPDHIPKFRLDLSARLNEKSHYWVRKEGSAKKEVEKKAYSEVLNIYSFLCDEDFLSISRVAEYQKLCALLHIKEIVVETEKKGSEHVPIFVCSALFKEYQPIAGEIKCEGSNKSATEVRVINMCFYKIMKFLGFDYGLMAKNYLDTL